MGAFDELLEALEFFEDERKNRNRHSEYSLDDIFDIKDAIAEMVKPKAEEVFDVNYSDGRWKCGDCGRINARSIDICGCGHEKKIALKRFAESFDANEAHRKLRAASEEVVDSNKWKCKNCGTINNNYVGVCRCGFDKRNQSLDKESGASGKYHRTVVTKNGDWTCPKCHERNFAYVGTCKCGYNKRNHEVNNTVEKTSTQNVNAATEQINTQRVNAATEEVKPVQKTAETEAAIQKRIDEAVRTALQQAQEREAVRYAAMKKENEEAIKQAVEEAIRQTKSETYAENVENTLDYEETVDTASENIDASAQGMADMEALIAQYQKEKVEVSADYSNIDTSQMREEMFRSDISSSDILSSSSYSDDLFKTDMTADLFNSDYAADLFKTDYAADLFKIDTDDNFLKNNYETE